MVACLRRLYLAFRLQMLVEVSTQSMPLLPQQMREKHFWITFYVLVLSSLLQGRTSLVI